MRWFVWNVRPCSGANGKTVKTPSLRREEEIVSQFGRPELDSLGPEAEEEMRKKFLVSVPCFFPYFSLKSRVRRCLF